MGKGGVKNPEKLPTTFMDGPYSMLPLVFSTYSDFDNITAKIHTLLCEVTINSIGKCFGFFFHPHLRIKSKTSAYI